MDGAELDAEIEVVDALPVLTDVRPLEPNRPAPAGALAQTAAVAATGFVAGAATAAVFGRKLGRRLAARNGAGALSPGPRQGVGGELVEVVATRTFLVNVHLLGRREQ